jgi:hypothetical protein
MKDTYKILEITEKSPTDFQISYGVTSPDVPYFKAMVAGTASTDLETILEKVNEAAHTQLNNRREKAANELAARTEEERTANMWETLKTGIEELKGTDIPLKKPKEKKRQLKAPEDKD